MPRADALRVLALGVDEVFAFRYLAHFALLVMTDWEKCLLQLPVVYLREEVGLVLHGVGARREPFSALLVNLGLRIVTGRDEIVLVSALPWNAPNLMSRLHITSGLGVKLSTHLVHGVTCHLIPVFAVAIHHLQFAARRRATAVAISSLPPKCSPILPAPQDLSLYKSSQDGSPRCASSYTTTELSTPPESSTAIRLSFNSIF